VFVSYSRKDALWLERFAVMLRPQVRKRGIELWFDTQIATGRAWRPEIDAAIARAGAALLLVSPDFLASDFIIDLELPALTARKVPLACALLRACDYGAVDALERVQWAHDPVRDGPIAARPDAEIDGAIRDVVAALIDMLHAVQPAAGVAGRRPDTQGRVRFNLPAVAPSFTGREDELAALDKALGSEDRVLITQAVTGLGGVGKSQLAARYAHTRSGAYDLVAWIAAEEGGTGDLARLAARLGLKVEGLSPDERAQLALEWFAETDRRWLLVLDNIESAEQLQGLRPAGEQGRVLVTSRDRTLRQFGPVLAVDVFDEDTATRYLTNRADRPEDQAGARELARALGCLPLALSHAAAYCVEGTSFAEYIALLDGLPAAELFDTHPELSYARTVASTWKPSITAASALAPLAGAALEMAAFLAPDGIPKALFTVLVGDDTIAERKRLADALNALARYCLALVDDDTIGVHRLLQKTVRDTLAVRGDQRPGVHALRAVDEAFPGDVQLPATWPACERLLAHALALANALTDPGDHSSAMLRLLNRACRYLLMIGTFARAIDATAQVLAHATRLLGDEHPHTLTARSNVAFAYWQAGRTADAIALEERVAADRERLFGDEHPDTLTARANLGVSYWQAERTAEAIVLQERVLADHERLLGDEHPDTLKARANLANSYYQAGRTADAIVLQEQVLVDSERLLGDEHPETLTSRANIATSYYQAGRTAEAIALQERVLAERERLLGDEHPSTLTIRNNLAASYADAGRVHDAIAIYEPLLDTIERVLGANHPNTLTLRGNLAHAYRTAGRPDDAARVQPSSGAPTAWP